METSVAYGEYSGITSEYTSHNHSKVPYAMNSAKSKRTGISAVNRAVMHVPRDPVEPVARFDPVTAQMTYPGERPED
jgi:hypothetical protein